MRINRVETIEYRSQKSEVRSQVTGIRYWSLVGVWILVFGLCLTSCAPKHPKSYDNSTLITYAELTLLYEKEKMVNKQTDSTYKAKVQDFFAIRGLQQQEFKKKIETISQDDEEWKIFIQDVSTAMDSLKRVEAIK